MQTDGKTQLPGTQFDIEEQSGIVHEGPDQPVKHVQVSGPVPLMKVEAKINIKNK